MSAAKFGGYQTVNQSSYDEKVSAPVSIPSLVDGNGKFLSDFTGRFIVLTSCMNKVYAVTQSNPAATGAIELVNLNKTTERYAFLYIGNVIRLGNSNDNIAKIHVSETIYIPAKTQVTCKMYNWGTTEILTWKGQFGLLPE